MPQLFRVILPVSSIESVAELCAIDPFGNPLCFVDRSTVFTG